MVKANFKKGSIGLGSSLHGMNHRPWMQLEKEGPVCHLFSLLPSCQFSFAAPPPPPPLRQVSLGSPLAGLRLTAACLCLRNAEVTV